MLIFEQFPSFCGKIVCSANFRVFSSHKYVMYQFAFGEQIRKREKRKIDAMYLCLTFYIFCLQKFFPVSHSLKKNYPNSVLSGWCFLLIKRRCFSHAFGMSQALVRIVFEANLEVSKFETFLCRPLFRSRSKVPYSASPIQLRIGVVFLHTEGSGK